jgi:3-methyladenine DNA glycosylase AlkD
MYSEIQMTVARLRRDLVAAGDPQRAASAVWFFKTGKGQYGEGDRFVGVPVPVLRKIALGYTHLSLADIEVLLASKIHEHRAAALEILVAQYRVADADVRQAIFDFYLKNTARINNWDLVDASARDIVGGHLLKTSKQVLYRLARSPILWERRIAIVATLKFLKAGRTIETFRLAKLLLADPHDLIHKAVGWTLREAGKVSPDGLLQFLEANYGAIPRTTFRYAIERFSPATRKRLLAGKFI